MALGGQIGSGIKAGYSTNGGSSWVEIVQISEGVPPQFERDDVETTIHGNTSIRTEIPGLSTVSDSTLNLLADLDRGTSPSHMGLKDLEVSQATILYRYEVPIDADLATTDYLAYQYNARVKSWQLNTPIDDKKTIDVAFKFAGPTMTLQEGVASVF